MKDRVLMILKSAMAGAGDNLFRAQRQFGLMTEEELDQESDQAGKTCRDILRKCKKDYDELKRCVEWVKRQGD